MNEEVQCLMHTDMNDPEIFDKCKCHMKHCGKCGFNAKIHEARLQMIHDGKMQVVRTTETGKEIYGLVLEAAV